MPVNTPNIKNILNRLPENNFTIQTVVLAAALFITSCTNAAFFRHIIQAYGFSLSLLPKFVTTFIILWAVTFILLSLASFRSTTKPLLIFLLCVSSQTAYFMDLYDVVIDTNMLHNALETNWAETRDLLSLRQLGYLTLICLIPASVIWQIKLTPSTSRQLLFAKLKGIGLALAVIIILMLSFSKFYASFLREHKPLRYYANPAYPLFSIGKLVKQALPSPTKRFQQIGLDARQQKTVSDRRLVILVVGEAVRWDHLGLNGYKRDTTPLLRHEEIINYPQFSSCGTETGVSVPCMFSVFGRNGYSKEKGNSTENALDLLKRAGVQVLWRDNNSDSKGVAVRLPYQDFKSSTLNPLCDAGECRDEGMLAGLQELINQKQTGDILIVLHQMGNHGPAYYKRYPAAFEKFKPVCQTNQLEQCSQESIINAYDNALLYTDHFLSKTISFLKQQESSFQTAMLYMSDHGESLGENGIYLHGFPYSFAPEAQTHVAALAWFGTTYPVKRDQLRQQAGTPYTHDYLFHTLLGMFEVSTTLYRPELDLFRTP